MDAEFKTYDRTPKRVEAFKWTPEIVFPGIEIPQPRIVLSEDKNYYFVEHIERPSVLWLTTRKIAGPVPKHRQKEKPHGWVQFAEKDGSEIYHRKVLPFAFFPDIKPNREIGMELDPSGQMLFDYAYANEWPSVNLEVSTGILRSQGQVFRVNNGDYIIKDGEVIHCLPENMFLANYALGE